MTGKNGTAEIKTRYPVTKGLIARTTTQTGIVENLVPEQGSLVNERNRKLIL